VRCCSSCCGRVRCAKALVSLGVFFGSFSGVSTLYLLHRRSTSVAKFWVGGSNGACIVWSVWLNWPHS
jgi:hypothetical protein